jgi:hypothetical protein
VQVKYISLATKIEVTSLLLIFKSSIEARNFYSMFNCAKIDSSKELIYLLFVSEIYIDCIGHSTGNIGSKEKSKDKQVKKFIKSILNQTVVQIPTCVHC